MHFHKNCLLLLPFFLVRYATAQTKAAEFTLLHTQTTLPWKTLPSQVWHPGFKLSYLVNNNHRKRWVKEFQAGYLVHPHLFRMFNAGYGYRYEIIPSNNVFRLAAGLSAGPILQQTTEPVFEIKNGIWQPGHSKWQVKGFASLVLKAGYRVPGIKGMAAFAGINCWAHAPYVAQLTTVLPHRNYEISIQYNFSTLKK
ncbi:MAG: hypothetical protein H7Z13_00230 [Ferruginibacter sp.]|nr:hypothetical protein [Ferruginibacter sp.]